MLLVAAKVSKAKRFWSEELAHGQIVAGVQTFNPSWRVDFRGSGVAGCRTLIQAAGTILGRSWPCLEEVVVPEQSYKQARAAPLLE
jgi:hypothetical protein